VSSIPLYRRLVGALLLVVAVVAGPAARAQGLADEYTVKAAFLYHFTQFVEWPADTWSDPEQAFRLCVLGHDPFGEVLDEVVAGERVAGRRIEVRRLQEEAETAGCQIVFLSGEEPAERLRMLPPVEVGRRLTVGESEGFLAHGGLVRLRLRAGRVSLEINGPAVESSRLKVSSKLLRLARLVRPEAP
jgi:hypothetical protein